MWKTLNDVAADFDRRLKALDSIGAQRRRHPEGDAAQASHRGQGALAAERRPAASTSLFDFNGLEAVEQQISFISIGHATNHYNPFAMPPLQHADKFTPSEKSIARLNLLEQQVADKQQAASAPQASVVISAPTPTAAMAQAAPLWTDKPPPEQDRSH